MPVKFLDILIDSFKLLKKQPKLFLPKILIAFLYSIVMLSIASISLNLYPLIQEEVLTAEEILLIQSTFPVLLFLLILTLLILVLDVLFNAMYSSMVDDFFSNRKIHFLKSFRLALKKFFVVVPAVIVSEAIVLLVAMPFVFALSFTYLAGNYFLSQVLALILLLIMFFSIILFYLLYPVSVLEDKNFIGAIFKTVSLSRKNIANISKASVITFFLSLFSFVLAFLSENAGAFALFIVVRFLIAVIATYAIVLNPVFYLEFERSQQLVGK